jgi:hypothetical protein
VSVPATGEESVLYFYIPDLSEAPARALVSLITGPWLNVGTVQLVYVTVLLVLFGGYMESRDGSVRTASVFFATTFVAAVGAGAALHVIYPALIDNDSIRFSWERAWGGGSAGCYGILGARAARSRWPGLMLGVFASWEAFVWAVNLRSYTVAFHIIAGGSGFGLVRTIPYFKRGRTGDSGPVQGADGI